MIFSNSIKIHVKKLFGDLKNEEDLKNILKRKFTKKQYKVFLLFEKGKDFSEISNILKEDKKTVEIHYNNAIKKLNQEILKKEMII